MQFARLYFLLAAGLLVAGWPAPADAQTPAAAGAQTQNPAAAAAPAKTMERARTRIASFIIGNPFMD